MQLSHEEIKRIFLLSRKEGIWIAALAVGLLVVVNFNLILNTITQNTLLASSDVQESFATQIQAWLDSAPILNTITLVTFWVCVGLIAYSVIYAIYSLANEAKNEVVVEEEYVNTGDVKSRLHGPAVQIGIVAAILALGIISLGFIFPLYNSWFTNGVLTLRITPLTAILAIIGALVAIAINIYLFKVLIIWALILE